MLVLGYGLVGVENWFEEVLDPGHQSCDILISLYVVSSFDPV